MKKQYCNNGDSVILGKYWLFNNLWGEHTGSGSQCLWQSFVRGFDIAWGTRWNWTGQADTIKSFASAILGWHWGWKNSDSGLPIQISANQNIHTIWKFDINQTIPGAINITYDIWLSLNPYLGKENPTDEIMIWLYKSGDIKPIGLKQDIIDICGTSWELWKGPHPDNGWIVYSFVRVINTDLQELNLEDFFNFLLNYGLNNSNYLISIEAGVEVFTGSGCLETRSYFVDIK